MPLITKMERRTPHFIVTFRFKNDATYQDRYDSFIEQANQVATTVPWDQTTSFLAFEAKGTAETVCSDLYLKSAFDSTRDVMVVIDLDNKQKATRGEIEFDVLLLLGLGF